MLVLAETAREHALRIMMDWPRFLRAPEEPQAPRLQRLMHIDRDLRHSLDRAFSIGGACAYRKDDAKAAIAKLKALLEQAIFGEDLDRWQAKSSQQELEQWARASQTLRTAASSSAFR